jgi:K+/H+ antiporter YhaU regulatory subunit KhtT
MRRQSRYQEIAIDIATSIINGHYSEGDKISGSVSLSAKYNVSPETIRKAIVILKEHGVVNSSQKNGIKVLSTEKAIFFLDKNQNRTSIQEIQDEIESLTKQKIEIDKRLNVLIDKMISQLSAQRDVGIIYPLEINVNKDSHFIGKTLESCNFWDMTKATVIGIKKNNCQCISPSPDTIIEKDDIIVFVGKSNSYIKMLDYVNNKK